VFILAELHSAKVRGTFAPAAVDDSMQTGRDVSFARELFQETWNSMKTIDKHRIRS